MKNIEQTGIFFYNSPELIPDPLDYTELSAYAQGYKNVSKIWNYNDFPWTEENILKKIESHHLERLVIAGALPAASGAAGSADGSSSKITCGALSPRRFSPGKIPRMLSWPASMRMGSIQKKIPTGQKQSWLVQSSISLMKLQHCLMKSR